MLIRLLLCTVLVLLTCNSCRLIYRQNIQQGNAIEQDDLDELYEGMNKRQVLFVLGTPSIMDPFHQDRWDYVQTFSRRGGDLVQRTVTLHFEDDLLTEIVGGDDPFAASTGDDEGDPNAVAIFSKQPGSDTNAEGPQEAAVESAEEDVLSPQPDIDYIEERTSEDREYQQDMDVLDQTPDDGPMGPDIDG